MYNIIYSIFTIKFVPTKTLVANFNLTKKVISSFWKKISKHCYDTDRPCKKFSASKFWMNLTVQFVWAKSKILSTFRPIKGLLQDPVCSCVEHTRSWRRPLISRNVDKKCALCPYKFYMHENILRASKRSGLHLKIAKNSTNTNKLITF